MAWGPVKDIQTRVKTRHQPAEKRADILLQSEARLTVNYRTDKQKQAIHDLCKSQKWPNLHIKNRIPIGDTGAFMRGVLATAPYNAGDLIADYHGNTITPDASDQLMLQTDDNDRRSDYLMKMPNGIHVDAHAGHCDCHEEIRTFGRLFNWSNGNDKVNCNMRTHFYTFNNIAGGTQGFCSSQKGTLPPWRS
jgi:hypothetical protein